MAGTTSDIPTTTVGGFGTGNWLLQPTDFNDWKYKLPAGYKQQDKSIDLRGTRKMQTDIFNQGGMGSCTANAIAEALRYAYAREGHDTTVPWRPSRLFVYYLERVADGAGDMITLQQLQDFLGKKSVTMKVNGQDTDVFSWIASAILKDDGADLRNGMKALNQYGVCSEDTWKYPTAPAPVNNSYKWTDGTELSWDDWWSKFKSTPDYYNPANLQDALKQAPDFISKTFTYWRINDYSDGVNYSGVGPDGKALWPGPNDESWTTVEYIKAALSEGLPIMFGFWAPDDNSFDDLQSPWSYDSKITSVDQKVFGHAVTLVAFDDDKQQFTILNSWGDGWGQGGYFYLPYSWFQAKDCTYSSKDRNGNLGTFPRVANLWVLRMKTAS